MPRHLLACLFTACLLGHAAAQPDPCAPGPGLPPETSAPIDAPQPPPVQPPAVQPLPPPPPPPPKPTREELDARASYEPSSIALGGFVQPRLRFREGRPEPGVLSSTGDTNGFVLVRPRLTALGQTRAGNLELSAYFEYDLSDGLFDAYATVARHLPQKGRVELDAGLVRVPLSRQQLLHDKRLAFVEKAQLAALLPERDVGVRVNVAVPGLKAVRVLGGVFNGDGRRALENGRNSKYLYAARVELSPFGRDRPLGESMFGGAFLTIGASIGKNTTSEDLREAIAGIDISLAFAGLSASFEYLESDLESRDGAFQRLQSGWTAQVNYLVPARLPPHRQARLELGVRFEELDRGPMSSTPANQATTAVLSYYLRAHALKAQVAITSTEETDAALERDNNQVLFQLQYAIE